MADRSQGWFEPDAPQQANAAPAPTSSRANGWFIPDAPTGNPNNAAGTQEAPQESWPNTVNRLSGDVLSSLWGDVQGTINAPHNILNAIPTTATQNAAAYLPNINATPVVNKLLGLPQNPSPVDKALQEYAGFAPFGPAGEELAVAHAAEGMAPTIGQRVGAQGLVGTQYGVTHPEQANGNAIQSGLQSGGLNAAYETGIGALGAAAAGKAQPYAEQFINNLSGGRNLEQNGQNIASKVRSAYNWLTKDPQNPNNFARQYDNLLNGNGGNNTLLYSPSSPITGTGNKGEVGSLRLSKDDFPNDSTTWNKYQDFIKNPTPLNAHQFQSYVGKTANKINTSISDPRKNNLDTYWKTQNAVKSDLTNTLNKINPNLADQYQELGQSYKNEVVPYQSTPTLRNIVNGFNTNPTNAQILRIFKNPQAATQKIVSHQSPDFQNQILHAGLGISPQNITPDKLLRATNNLDNKGMSSYLTPENEAAINTIPHRQAKQDLLHSVMQMGARGLAGATIGHALNAPEALGAILAASTGAPNALHVLRNTKFATNPITNLIAKAAKKTINPLARSAVVTQAPNALNDTQNEYNYLRGTQ